MSTANPEAIVRPLFRCRTRRLVMAALLAISLLLTPGYAQAKHHKASKPNIVYILLDDAGYGDLSCYGQKKFATPHIDKLAAQGLRFTDHYSGSTVCAPTRSSLMTGLHTGHTPIRGNREVRPEGQAPMPADTVTLPRLLQKAGYATGMFGKWGLGAPGTHADPMEHFNRFYGYNCQREAHTYYPGHLWSDRKKHVLDGKTYSSDLIMNEAMAFIEKHAKAGKPFFCYLPTPVPHAAMHVPAEDHDPWRKKFPQFEEKIGRYKGPQVKNPVAAMAGMMDRFDRQVGQVMALIKKLGIDDNTLVMLSSDNGPHKEGGHQPDFFDSNGPLKGYKRDLYEGGIRVPLIARWPGKIKPGTTSDLISAHWDMLPTFTELAGAKNPSKLDGISMVPTLMGKADQQKQHKYLYWEFHERGKKQAVRLGKWKGVRLNLAQNPNAPFELYDLSQDIGEKNNIADKHPDVVKQMQAIVKEAHVPSETFVLFGDNKAKGKNNKAKGKNNKKLGKK